MTKRFVILFFNYLYFKVYLIFLLQGSRINATIKYGTIKKAKAIIIEGHIYAIKDVIVADNRLKYKTTSNKYKINFINKTNICEIFDEYFPKKMFEFKTFEKLQNVEAIDETELFGKFFVIL